MGQWPRTVEKLGMNTAFWHGKRVFVTGHTGFKGSWLSLWLQQLGADIAGYALAPTTQPNLFEQTRIAAGMHSQIADIRDADAVAQAVKKFAPEIVFHLAAQPLVRLSYAQPVETYATNVMGTVHVLEAIRAQPSVRAAIFVTSDKCYANDDRPRAFREDDPMGGHDPYSSSKGCAELVCAAYRDSFLRTAGIALATARAGNVIGGGDWAADRLVPDILRAMEHGNELSVRNPLATRPWQHVLEPLAGYLMLAEKLHRDGEPFAGAWNFGPAQSDVQPVESIVRLLADACGKPLRCVTPDGAQPHEAHSLALDSSKAHAQLGWAPRWALPQALQNIAEWHRAYTQCTDLREITLQQIADYTATNPSLRSTNHAA